MAASTNSNEASSISTAKKYGATYIIGSIWSPPANCKTNNSTQKGGHVIASCYGVLVGFDHQLREGQ